MRWLVQDDDAPAPHSGSVGRDAREGGGNTAEQGNYHKRGGEVQNQCGRQGLLGQEVASDERQLR